MDVIRVGLKGAEGGAVVRFDADDPLFEGHFPGTPVLPGVALIDATVSLVSRALGHSLRLRRIANVKFVSVVSPGQEIACALKLTPEADPAGPVTVGARWTRGSEKVADLTFTAGPDDAGEGLG